MRSCDEIVELISASLDGELCAAEQAALDEHIACCPACSALLDDLRALHTAVADLEEVPAPTGFAEAVMSAIAAETEQKKPDNVIPFPAKKATRTHWKQWTVSAAAIAIVVLGAVSAPSLMGNFAQKSAVAEDADMAYAVQDSLTAEAEAVMDQAMPQASAYAETEVQKADAVAEENTSTKGNAPAESTADTEVGDASDPHCVTGSAAPSEVPETDVERYAGILILEGPLAMLDKYEGAACSDGTVTYLVPAGVFAEVFSLLEAEKPVGYGYAAGNPDAELGKIVVQSN